MSVHIITSTPAVITAAVVAQTAAEGDLATALLQLGIGGVLVSFGAVIYKRFETRSDRAVIEHKAEVERLQNRHDNEIAAERQAHDKTRSELLALLLHRPKREGDNP